MQITLLHWPGADRFALELTRATFVDHDQPAAMTLLDFAIEPQGTDTTDAPSGAGTEDEEGATPGASRRAVQREHEGAGWSASAARTVRTSDLVLVLPGKAPSPCPMNLRKALRDALAVGASVIGIGPGIVLLGDLGLVPLAVLRTPGCRQGTVGDAIVSSAQGGTRAGPVTAILLDWLQSRFDRTRVAQTAARLGLPPPTAPEGGERTDPILGLMRANLQRPLPLTALAAALGLSAKQLRARCLRQYGLTPAQVYSGLRLDRARRLAETTRLPVPDLAREAGFASAASFTRAYRLRFGATPRGPSPRCLQA